MPPLTTVALPGRAIAARAVATLLQGIEDASAKAEMVILDESLVIRESTSPPGRSD